MRRLPPGLRGRYAPGAETAAIDDWERRIAAIAARVNRQDVRLLAGMPSWMLILFEHVARAREHAGRPLRDLAECWPNLGVFIHGGVSFAPYHAVFEDWIGRPLPCVEVYPASEGFVAIQTEPGGALTLMPLRVRPRRGSRSRSPSPSHRRRGRAGPRLRGGSRRRARDGDVAMTAPGLVELPPGTFHRWMRSAGKLGDQHKVPRATNGRRLAEALLEHAASPVIVTETSRQCHETVASGH